ncbi:F0F1 ATP synthase subunit epsilon [Acidimangrovimonas sediminis]|uniref:F0F1 ATP synthase subunit epsilon n=1 Tax=Acidimangrovimonas sediminis TaxID=2056283 RepID=UPI0011AF321A|nr:F0F1 ATP synthase subunit epsilon [Acidimangrovimonas sediminis]
MRLVITTPRALVLDAPGVGAVRAEDESGSFGILPGHADFLTVLTVSVLTWTDAAGAANNVALRRGVLRVAGGDTVSVAAREAVAGGTLEELETAVLARFRAVEREETAQRVSTERLHLATMRALHRYLGAQSGLGTTPPDQGAGPDRGAAP